MKKLLVAFIICLSTGILSAQNISIQEYILRYKDIAISEMKRSGIPASVTLAQGILETENGNSELVKKSNNHFGIKCKNAWTGESVSHTDDAPDECFRKYNTAADSYKDHSDFLRSSTRYASLFNLQPNDYRGWAYGLKKAGYATNPRYPQILITNIEQNNLHQYDIGDGEEHTVFADVKFVEPVGKETLPVVNSVNTADEKLLERTSSSKSKSLFNRLHAVYVVKGTSVLAVATRENIGRSKLMEFNDLISDGLLPAGQWLYLERKPKTGNRDFYISLQNESLYDIAQNNAVQLNMLALYNQLNENVMVKIGTRIKLRP